MAPADMTPEQAAEREFCVFKTPAYGFRAMAKVFNSYHNLHGVITVEQAVKRWAPASENNVPAYVRSVCDYTGLSPTDPMPFPNGRPAQQRSFLKAFSIHEAGGWFFSMADLAAGVQMAETS